MLNTIQSVTAACLTWLAAAPFLVAQQAPRSYPVIGEIVREDPALDTLVPPGTRIEVLASGFEWSEGPAWVKKPGFLVFSDIPLNTVYKWSPAEGLSVFLKPSGYTGIVPYGREPGSNGIVVDPQGRLVFCEHGDRRVSVLYPDGGKMTLADNYEGKRLNSPNDAVFRSNGDLYFTDPPYGLPQQWSDPRRELDFCGVYLLRKGGELKLLTKELSRPNGIALAPDEKTLYVANSDPEHAVWMAYPVLEDGSLGPGRVFADAREMVRSGRYRGLPDGMAVDVAGNLFATGPGGVHVFTPEGKRLGRIDTGEATANCTFGDDGTTLYLTSDMYLCRLKTRTKGLGF